MLKKTITYTDYNGVDRTEDFYFNLTKAELMEWELSTNGGLTTIAQRIVAAKDQVKLIKLFREIIDKSYGVKSEDGRRFVKNDEVLSEFQQSPAYSQLYMELITDDNAGSAFVNAVLPSDLVEQAAQEGSRQAFALA